MPTYDYLCQSCEHTFEEFQSITARPLRKCPECGKMQLKRLIGTGAGIIFKGSGFYQTDYRSDSYTQAAKADKPKAESKTADTKNGSSNGKKTSSSDTSKADSKKPAAAATSSSDK